MRYYHVTEKWDGSDLESMVAQCGSEELAVEKFLDRWADAGVELAGCHAHYVHMFAALEEAIEEANYGELGSVILQIDDPEGYLEVVSDETETGLPHPVVRGRIPAEHISVWVGN